MAKRGRKSQAELVSAPVQSLGARPQPPLCLNARAEAEWRRVVDAMPSDWFRPQTLALLQSYCSLVAEVEWHELMIEKVRKTAMTNDDSWKRYQELVKLHDTCIGRMLAVATKMRMTHQASYTTKASGTAKRNHSVSGPFPWEFTGLEANGAGDDDAR